MKLGNLKPGEYALTVDGMAVLALSPRSFTPREGYANVVHLANGIGSFLENHEVYPVTRERAFQVAMESKY